MGSSASSQFNDFVIPLISHIVQQDDVSTNTLLTFEFQNMTYQDFLTILCELNQVSKRYLDSSEKRLVFAVKRGSDSTVFWKATIQIACVKLNSNLQTIDSYRLFNLSEFLKIFKTLQCQCLAIQQSKSVDAPEEEACLSASSFFSQLDNITHRSTDKVDCCICFERVVEVSLPCTHSFCTPCIEEWNEFKLNCPICREKFESTDDTWVLSDVPNADEISRGICSALLNLADDKSCSYSNF